MASPTPFRLIVGLGNPGTQYAGTRHNAGFDFVDRLAAEAGVGPKEWKKQGNTLICEARIGGRNLLLAKPQTYMNLSGGAVLGLLAREKMKPAEILVAVDDVNLDAGAVRIRRDGSHGGQNGLRDIIANMGPQFARVRIGVGKCPAGKDLADHVLSRFTPEERTAYVATLDKAPEIAALLVSEGVEAAMNRWN